MPEPDHFTRCGGEPGEPAFYGTESEANLTGFDGYCRGCPDCEPASGEEAGEGLTQIEMEALLYSRMGGSPEELQDLVEARRSGEEKLRRQLEATKPMKLRVGDGGDPAGMNDAIYAAEFAATHPQNPGGRQ